MEVINAGALIKGQSPFEVTACGTGKDRLVYSTSLDPILHPGKA